MTLSQRHLRAVAVALVVWIPFYLIGLWAGIMMVDSGYRQRAADDAALWR